MPALWWFLWGQLTLACFLASALWASLANTAAKAQATEDRLPGMVAAIGNAQATANGALPKTGGTISGDLYVTGWCWIDGDTRMGGTMYAKSGALAIGSPVTQTGGNITSGGTNVTGASSWVNNSCYPNIGGNLATLGGIAKVSSPPQIPSAPATYQQSSDQTFRVDTNDISSQLQNAGIFS